MNEHLHKFIGKPITVVVKLFVDGSLKEEYIQGILKDVDNDVLNVEQHIPFCNLFIKDAETQKTERKINIQNTVQNGIKLF